MSYCDDDRYEYEHDDGCDVSGYCDECGQECYGVLRDDGIGSYEYWGSRGTHHDWVAVSNCCEAKILDDNPCCENCGKHERYDDGLCEKCYAEAVVEA